MPEKPATINRYRTTQRVSIDPHGAFNRGELVTTEQVAQPTCDDLLKEGILEFVDTCDYVQEGDHGRGAYVARQPEPVQDPVQEPVTTSGVIDAQGKPQPAAPGGTQAPSSAGQTTAPATDKGKAAAKPADQEPPATQDPAAVSTEQADAKDDKGGK